MRMAVLMQRMRAQAKYVVTAAAGLVLVCVLIVLNTSTTVYTGVSVISGDDEQTGSTEESSGFIQEYREIHAQRRKHVRDVCQRNEIHPNPKNIVPSKFQYMYVDEKHKFLYCSIPKVACTNWKRVLLVLSNKTNVTHPLDLTPAQAHSAQNARLLKTLDEYTIPQIKHRLKNYFKFVFVRDPLERILSAYRNKFTVSYNDYFPQRYGKYIVKKFRKNPSRESLKRGRDVSFPEFVQYLLDPNTAKPFNAHWRHYFKLCHPCIVQYDAIGKYETLEDDIDYVLHESKVDHIVKFPRANRLAGRPKTSDILKQSYKNVSTEDIHRLWELYSVDYAMFGYPYPDFSPHKRH